MHDNKENKICQNLIDLSTAFVDLCASLHRKTNKSLLKFIPACDTTQHTDLSKNRICVRLHQTRHKIRAGYCVGPSRGIVP